MKIGLSLAMTAIRDVLARLGVLRLEDGGALLTEAGDRLTWEG